jgi:hypothetical protein
MRAKYLTWTIVFFFLLIGISREAYAQDEVPGQDVNSVSAQEPSEYDEKALLYEEGSRTSKPTASDSIQSRAPGFAPSPAKKLAPPLDLKKPKDEDPLNFNFLYYIITKFKSSDLMMEE